jgi:hypothetical protein
MFVKELRKTTARRSILLCDPRTTIQTDTTTIKAEGRMDPVVQEVTEFRDRGVMGVGRGVERSVFFFKKKDVRVSSNE